MKANQITKGGKYVAKVSGKLTTVRVDEIRTRFSYSGDTSRTVYDVTNLATGRRTTFRSASKFRASANTTPRWLEDLLPTVKRINAAGTPYRVKIGTGEITALHGDTEIGFATDARQADYLLRGIIRHVDGIEAANATPATQGG